MAMITAIAWVPRGLAAPFPTQCSFDDAEFERIASLAHLQLDDAKDKLEEAQEKEDRGSDGKEADKRQAKESARKDALGEGIEIDDDLKEYDLEHYDDDAEDIQHAGHKMGMFGNVKSLAYYESNEDDPYITLKDDADDDDDERQELQILSTDNIILSAKIEDELAHLEVYIYEDHANNLWVHHDIMLPAYPLCVERLDLPVGKPDVAPDAVGNFVAVGTFDPEIEIWDLDTVNCMYPNAILGSAATSEDVKTKKKRMKMKMYQKANEEHHVDAVLSLAANRQHRNLLASASADKTVKLWDLNTTKCAKSYSYHTDKVCALAWHSTETTVLLSGSYDRTVAVADMRAPTVPPIRIGVESDVENVRWDPHAPNCFFVSTERGLVHYFDARTVSNDPVACKPLWKLQAHDKSVSTFDINPIIPGFLATGSEDKTVKLWNMTAQGPSMVVSRDFFVGKVFTASFGPDPEVAFRLAVAGSKGKMTVWDTSTNQAVRKVFGSKMPLKRENEDMEDRLVGVDDDQEEASSEDDDDEGGGYEIDEN